MTMTILIVLGGVGVAYKMLQAYGPGARALACSTGARDLRAALIAVLVVSAVAACKEEPNSEQFYVAGSTPGWITFSGFFGQSGSSVFPGEAVVTTDVDLASFAIDAQAGLEAAVDDVNRSPNAVVLLFGSDEARPHDCAGDIGCPPNCGPGGCGWSPADRSALSALINAPHRDTCVVVVQPTYTEATPADYRAQLDLARADIDALAATRPRTQIADWNPVLQAHPEYTFDIGPSIGIWPNFSVPDAMDSFTSVIRDATERCDSPAPQPGPDRVPFLGLFDNAVGCTYNNGCVVPTTGYHGYPAIDFMIPRGTPVLAAGPGAATAHPCGSDCDSGFGNYVEIVHPNGRHSIYAHLESLAFTGTRSVGSQEVVGAVGDTGFAFGAHLHYEERKGADAMTRVDPGVMHGTANGSIVADYPAALGPYTNWSQVPCGVQPDEPNCTARHTMGNLG